MLSPLFLLAINTICCRGTLQKSGPSWCPTPFRMPPWLLSWQTMTSSTPSGPSPRCSNKCRQSPSRCALAHDQYLARSLACWLARTPGSCCCFLQHAAGWRCCWFHAALCSRCLPVPLPARPLLTWPSAAPRSDLRGSKGCMYCMGGWASRQRGGDTVFERVAVAYRPCLLPPPAAPASCRLAGLTST